MTAANILFEIAFIVNTVYAVYHTYCFIRKRRALRLQKKAIKENK